MTEVKRINILLNELKQHDWQTNWSVARELARIGPSAVPRLIDALTDKDGYIRAAAASALGMIRDVRAVAPLIAAMQYHDDQVYEDDEDAEARINSAKALGKIGDLRALDALLRAASSEDSQVAAYAIDALGMLGDIRAIPTLIQALKVSDVDIPKSACSALVRIGTASVLPLVESLESSRGHWRIYALKALGAIGDRRAMPSVKALLNDDEEHVRVSAAATLKELQRRN